MHDHDRDERRRLRHATHDQGSFDRARPAPGRSTLTSRLPARRNDAPIQRRVALGPSLSESSSGAREIDLSETAPVQARPTSNPAPWGPGLDPFGLSHLWGVSAPAAPEDAAGVAPPEARDDHVGAAGQGSPVQRRVAANLDRSAVRDAATIDAPEEVEETRSTLSVETAPQLSSRQLVRARRANVTYHARLGYDPAVFGGGEPDSAELAEAVAAYQAGHGLAVDGIAGPRTCSAAGTGRGRHASAGRPAAGAPVEPAVAADPARPLDRDAVRDPVTIDARPEWEESRSTLDVDAAADVDTAPAAEIQMRGAGPAEAGERTHAIAAAGLAGTGAPLPDAVKQSFGRHAVDGVQVHTGPEAAAAARALGADGYTSGTDIALAAPPTLDLLGHEAAHAVQQRAGVSLRGGVGAAGDIYEQNADAVGAAVAAGQSAEALLDQVAPPVPRRAARAACSGGRRRILAP
jgi:Domain of unknown function (DUF4157)/Putative peptidoglycan binding domain